MVFGKNGSENVSIVFLIPPISRIKDKKTFEAELALMKSGKYQKAIEPYSKGIGLRSTTAGTLISIIGLSPFVLILALKTILRVAPTYLDK